MLQVQMYETPSVPEIESKNLSGAEFAKIARTHARAQGLGMKDLSVRADHSSVRWEIKSWKAFLMREWVKKMVSQFQSIRYCEASGEILSGGNRFMSESSFEDEAVLGAVVNVDEIVAEIVAAVAVTESTNEPGVERRELLKGSLVLEAEPAVEFCLEVESVRAKLDGSVHVIFQSCPRASSWQNAFEHCLFKAVDWHRNGKTSWLRASVYRAVQSVLLTAMEVARDRKDAMEAARAAE